jgi:hypothetical protein
VDHCAARDRAIGAAAPEKPPIPAGLNRLGSTPGSWTFFCRIDADRPPCEGAAAKVLALPWKAPSDTWIGQRDRLMLTLMFDTGARVSEIIGVRVADVFGARANAWRSTNAEGRKRLKQAMQSVVAEAR